MSTTARRTGARRAPHLESMRKRGAVVFVFVRAPSVSGSRPVRQLRPHASTDQTRQPAHPVVLAQCLCRPGTEQSESAAHRLVGRLGGSALGAEHRRRAGGFRLRRVRALRVLRNIRLQAGREPDCPGLRGGGVLHDLLQGGDRLRRDRLHAHAGHRPVGRVGGLQVRRLDAARGRCAGSRALARATDAACLRQALARHAGAARHRAAGCGCRVDRGRGRQDDHLPGPARRARRQRISSPAPAA